MNILYVILAAGYGKRMGQDMPKVLHSIGNFPMIGHVIDSIIQYDSKAHMCIVVSLHTKESVKQFVDVNFPEYPITYVTQDPPKGTGDAVLSAVNNVDIAHYTRLVVLLGDVPFIDSTLLHTMVHATTDVLSVGFSPKNPVGYGHFIIENNQLISIVEDKDIQDESVSEWVNSGLFSFNAKKIRVLLQSIKNNNTQKEYYLTDTVSLAHSQTLSVNFTIVLEETVLGINNLCQLSKAEAVFQNRIRNYMMDSGVYLPAPETVFFSYDTMVEKGTMIEPNVIFGLGVRIERNVRIYGFSHIARTHITQNAVVGPYARIREGSTIGEGSVVGNFVEINRSTLAKNVKIKHLTYVGDGHIGDESNIGAGTIFCNYDGFKKYPTTLGKGVFVGSNSTLIAPLELQDNTMTAAGSVVTKTVHAGSMVISRSEEIHLHNATKLYRKKRKEK